MSETSKPHSGHDAALQYAREIYANTEDPDYRVGQNGARIIARTLLDLEEQLEAVHERCPICTHEWRRHDPEDGKCDAGSEDFGECRCGRDLAYHRVRNASLSHARLLDGSNPAKEPDA